MMLIPFMLIKGFMLINVNKIIPFMLINIVKRVLTAYEYTKLFTK